MRRVILGALIISVATCLSAQEQARVSTRFGSLTVGNNKELLFRGRSVVPSIVGNNGLDLGTPFHLKAEDVVLVTDNGGTACPYLYYFVTLNQSGAKGTTAFGTCNVANQVKRDGDSIRVTMHGYRGPFEPESERRSALRAVHVFVFRDGAVHEDNTRPK